MDNNTNDFRGYYRHNKAWYKSKDIEVSFGLYSIDGGSLCEMTMEWILLDGDLCAQLQCFEDSWKGLASFGDLIQKLGENDSKLIQEDDFCKILDECGFKDLTPYIYEGN